jgi:hypothetical protein
MSLDGFDPRWTDFPDYIIGITKEIWEDRGISRLHDYYSRDILVRAPAGIVVGNENVIGATMMTLAEFPDRALLGEDVIWSDDGTGRYLSSHRLFSTATHSNDGVYGKAMGTRLQYRIMADCAAKGNVIDDEWIIRDQGAIVRQLGIDPKTYAADEIARQGGADTASRPFTPAVDKQGPYTGRGNEHAIGARYADLLQRIMGAEMSVIPTHYDRACHLELPGGVTRHGYAAADEFWMNLRSAFPSATFEVHHVIGRDDPEMPPRAALRWSLTGKHEGFGAFGPPSHADVHVMGISHAEFGPWGLRREYVAIDETAIWKQILLGAG